MKCGDIQYKFSSVILKIKRLFFTYLLDLGDTLVISNFLEDVYVKITVKVSDQFYMRCLYNFFLEFFDFCGRGTNGTMEYIGISKQVNIFLWGRWPKDLIDIFDLHTCSNIGQYWNGLSVNQLKHPFYILREFLFKIVNFSGGGLIINLRYAIFELTNKLQDSSLFPSHNTKFSVIYQFL